MDETARRRQIQMDYNDEHGLTPQPLNKSTDAIMKSSVVLDYDKEVSASSYKISEELPLAAEPDTSYYSAVFIDQKIIEIKAQMEAAAKDMNFIEAARLRDEMFAWMARK
jgi:excinuclease ABC subunit B